MNSPSVHKFLIIEDLYYEIVRQDICRAADLSLPVYEASGGKDGFVSIEVQPKFANNPSKTIAEAELLYKAIG